MEIHSNSSSKIPFDQFKELYKVKQIPDFSNLSNHDLLKTIYEHEKSTRGVDWLQANASGGGNLQGVISQYTNLLSSQVSSLSEEELSSAKMLGLINEDHSIAIAPLTGILGSTVSPATFPDGAPSYTVWTWKADKVAKYSKLRGVDVEREILNLVANFQVLAQDDIVGMVKGLMHMGIVALGKKAWDIIKATYQTLSALTEETEAYAIFQGVLSIGTNLVRLMVCGIILAILIPLMYLMSRDAIGLFVIINNTSSDLVMSNIECVHGKCITGFKEDADVDNTKAILPAAEEIFNPAFDKKIKMVSAGFLAVRKRDNALIGTLGGLSFAPTNEYPTGVYLGWEVPLIFGDNKLLVSANFNSSISDFADNVSDADRIDSEDTSSAGHTVEGHMNSDSGSHAYAFFVAN
ncbi:hypothetical protein [Paenibacillus kandeliae]|uniref:hypothetical protein n=1 Tax=Paenibacillus kandeliae TaxID=3231269 RepID=UPI003459E94A